MKKILLYLFTALPTTLIFLLVCYFLLYHYSANGLSMNTALFLLLLTPVLIFLITYIVGYKIFKLQLTTAFEQNVKIDKKNISFLFLLLSFVFCHLFFEYLYYFLVDKQISSNYSLKLFEISTDKATSSNSNEFYGLPFLTLNLFNFILLAIAVFFINKKAYKKFIPKINENKNNQST